MIPAATICRFCGHDINYDNMYKQIDNVRVYTLESIRVAPMQSRMAACRVVQVWLVDYLLRCILISLFDLFGQVFQVFDI